MSECILIPDAMPVSWIIATAPMETPAGVMEAATIDCEFDGRRYRLLKYPVCRDGSKPKIAAMDLETGDIVRLVVHGWFE